MGRRRAETADEADVYSKWYRVMCTYQRAGQRAKVKRRTRRRERLEAKREIRREVEAAS